MPLNLASHTQNLDDIWSSYANNADSAARAQAEQSAEIMMGIFNCPNKLPAPRYWAAAHYHTRKAHNCERTFGVLCQRPIALPCLCGALAGDVRAPHLPGPACTLKPPC